MNDSEFLTKDEVIELTGHKQPKAQARWLETNGITFFINAHGAPIIGRYYLREKLNGDLEVTKPAATSAAKEHKFQFARIQR